MEITTLDDRELLAAVVRHVIEVEVMYDDDDWHRIADAILAAGFTLGGGDRLMPRTPKQNLEYLAKWAERNAVVDHDNSTGLPDFDYGYAQAAAWVRDILNDRVTFGPEVTD